MRLCTLAVVRGAALALAVMGAIDKSILPTVADIEAAAKRLAGVAVRTPLINAPMLDEALGARIFLKAETLQRTGSFKFRGAYNKISSIPPERRAAGVVAYSSGNHAQGVAAAARLLGMRATIVMPSDAPKAKRDRTLALGAEVVPYDRNSEDRAAIAKQIMAERNATLVPPYDDPLIIAGPGHHWQRNCRRPGKALAQARIGGDWRVRWRSRGRNFTGHEIAGAVREILCRRARRF